MEPNRKERPEIEPEIRPRFNVVEGGGESTPERAGLRSAEAAKDLGDQEKKFGVIQGGGESTPDRADLKEAGTGNTQLIDDAKDRENDQSSNWKSNVTGAKAGKPKGLAARLKGLKKKGPLFAIIGTLVGGGSIFSILFAPGIGVVTFIEAIMGDLNDQEAALQIQSDHMFAAKLKGLQSGVCTSVVSYRCKLATMSSRQVENFKKAGFKVEPSEPDKLFGRTKVTSLTFPDNNDGTPGETIKNPNELRALLKNNPAKRLQMQKGFNPKVASFWDKVANGVFGRFKTDKAQKIDGTDEEEQKKSVTSVTAGETAGVNAEGYHTETTAGGDVRKYVFDEHGAKIYESSNPGLFNEIAEKNKAGLAKIGEAAKNAKPDAKAVGGVLKSGLKGLSVLGAADTACTVNNTARAVAAASKAARALQLVQFFMVGAREAHAIKAGDATPEGVEFVGNMLTAVDTNKTVVDESSTWEGSSAQTATAKAHDNPYYNKNAFDSPGYHMVQYNDAPLLRSRDLQYTIGGGLTGTLSSVLDKVASALGGRKNIRQTCKVVQSWWARGAGLVAGVISAIGSFGASTVISIGASVALGFATPFLEAALADIIAGTVVSGETNGVDAGDAAVVGGAALLGGVAMARGMKPASAGEFQHYLASTESIKSDLIAAETLDAKSTPFDINNQYSFLGSMVRTINPALIESTTSVSGALAAIPSIVSTGLASISPHASAANKFNPDRFKRCTTDEGYNDLGIDPDVFCNPRYVMSDKQLALGEDPDAVEEWMRTNGHVDQDGNPASDEYNEWLKACTERVDGWGETSNDDDNSDAAIGKLCMEVSDTHDYFAVFTMQKGLQEASDNGLESQGSATEPVSGGTQTDSALPAECATMAADDLGQIACKAYQFDNYGYLWGGGHGGTASAFMSNFKAGKYTAGKDAVVDCSGLVRMSIFEATGVDIGGMGTDSYPSYGKFKAISKTEAKAGDILYKSGHTEIIVSNDPAKQKYQTFGAHSAKYVFNKQIGPSSYSYSDVLQVFRFQKG